MVVLSGCWAEADRQTEQGRREYLAKRGDALNGAVSHFGAVGGAVGTSD